MAFIYEKPDPKGGTKRWMGRVKIGGENVAVSLRLKAAGTKRLAQQRVDTLQFEIDAGALTGRTTEWLGPATTARIGAMLAREKLGIKPESLASWEAAGLGYLQSCEAKDSKTPIPNTARTVERTKRKRAQNIKRITKSLDAAGVPFLKQSFTQTLIGHLKRRREEGGIGPGSLWTNDYTVGIQLGNYLHRRGLCEKPDRDLIREHMPRKPEPIVLIPPPATDARMIRFFRDNRAKVETREYQPSGGEGETKHAINTTKTRRWEAAWSLALCIRGLGCRPSEATALMWETVSPDLKVVHFLSTKTGIAREVPVLFEWVSQGLAELREKHGGVGPVCRSALGTAFTSDTSAPDCWKNILTQHKMPAYTLKKAQKCFIAQAIKAGFPPYVVANWTGHTLTVQERHYCESRSYLPSREQDEYGEIGKLSAWGEEVRSHLSAFSNLLPGNKR